MNQGLSLAPTNCTEDIILVMSSIQKELRDRMFEQTRQSGFTGPQLSVIFILHRNPYITLQELSEQMDISKSTVSGIIDRLVNRGVVKREIPEDNRRIVKLSLAAEFEEKNDLQEMKNKYIKSLLEEAAPKEAEVILAGLHALYALMKKQKTLK